MTVVAVCRKLGITRSSFYERRRQRKRREVDAELVVALVQAERRLQPRLGTRKLQVLLKERLEECGLKIGRDRFFEVLRERGLLVEPKPREYPRTTDSYHCLPVFENRLKGLELKGPNQAWVSDLTYVRTKEDFLYLALITDKWSRKIVGYHCGDTLEAIGCVKALEAALKELPAGARPIHHSDQGTQYCCHEYVNRLVASGLSISMTERNHCAENALAERVNGILKAEYLIGSTFRTKEAAKEAIKQAVLLYNTRRPHTALQFRFPQEVHSLAE